MFSAVMFVVFTVFAGLLVDFLVGCCVVGYCWFVFVCCLGLCERVWYVVCWIYEYWCVLLFVVAGYVCFKCDAWSAGCVGFGCASDLLVIVFVYWHGFVRLVGLRLILICLVK